MRWLFAGLAFAALVALAVATAAVRADNNIRRFRAEQRFTEVRDRLVEQGRLDARLLDTDTSRRLAELHRRWLEREFARRGGRLQ